MKCEDMTNPASELESFGSPPEQRVNTDLTLVPPSAPEGAFFIPPGLTDIDLTKPREYTTDELHDLFTLDEIKIIENSQHFLPPDEDLNLENHDENFVNRFQVLLNNVG